MPGGTALNTPQARVVDPVLSNVARGYKHPEAIGHHLFPDVEVGQRGGKAIEFNKDDFKKINTARTPGARTKRVQFGYVGKSYACIDHGIEGKVPTELMEDAAAVPNINLGGLAVEDAARVIKLGKEIEQATLATTADNYGANNKITLANKSQWSHADSNPTMNISAAVAQVRKSIGMRPKTVVLGGAVYDVVKTHPKIIAQIQHTGRDLATPEILAGLWDVDNVFVGDCIYFTDDDKVKDAWGDNVVVAYTPLGSLSMKQPTFGYTYQLKGYPMVAQPYYENNERSWMYPTHECYEAQIVGKDAGYLISDVLA